MNIAIQSDNLNTDSRYQLIKLAFNVILLLRQNAKGVRSRTNKKNLFVNVQFVKEINCKRTLNMLLVLGFVMKLINIIQNFISLYYPIYKLIRKSLIF